MKNQWYNCCVNKSIIGAEWLCVASLTLLCVAHVMRGLWTSAASHSFHLSEFWKRQATGSTRRSSMRHHCALKHGIVKEFLAEFLGTFVLVVSTFLYIFIYIFYFIFLGGGGGGWHQKMLSVPYLVTWRWWVMPACLLPASCLAAAPSPRRSSAETPWESHSPCTSASRWDWWWQHTWPVACQVILVPILRSARSPS